MDKGDQVLCLCYDITDDRRSGFWPGWPKIIYLIDKVTMRGVGKSVSALISR